MTAEALVNNPLNVGALTLSGALLGMPLEHFALGLGVGLLVVGSAPPTTRRAGLVTIFVTAFLAASLATPAAELAMRWLPFSTPPDTGAVVVIGLAWPWFVRRAVPQLWPWLAARLGLNTEGRSND